MFNNITKQHDGIVYKIAQHSRSSRAMNEAAGMDAGRSRPGALRVKCAEAARRTLAVPADACVPRAQNHRRTGWAGDPAGPQSRPRRHCSPGPAGVLGPGKRGAASGRCGWETGCRGALPGRQPEPGPGRRPVSRPTWRDSEGAARTGARACAALPCASRARPNRRARA